METGGRKDVRYNILCRQVLPDGRGLEECGPNVRFLPRRVGLSNTSVMVADLQSHTNYSFLLEAVNGVSELAKDHAKQYVSLNVTTNQAGMLHQICHKSDNTLQFLFFFFFLNQPPYVCSNQPHSCPVTAVFSLIVFRLFLNFPTESSPFSLLIETVTAAPTLDARRGYLGLIIKTPDDQIITLFVQQICRCADFHLYKGALPSKKPVWVFVVVVAPVRLYSSSTTFAGICRNQWHNESS